MQQNNTQANADDKDFYEEGLERAPEEKAGDEMDLDEMSEEEMLDVFVERMIEEKGIKGDEELRGKIREDLKEKLVFEINRGIVAALPDGELEKFEKEIDGEEPSAEALNKIVEESGVEVDKIVEETMLKFREGYLKAEE